ncbi:MDR family MFS transporter [Novosphingobium album (ex Liu et al. 2023)]|uniref:MDR family MFS transporter n=1 Tax=Novosphingobium album (ex Liu et al. 2023) TaxID=3031130 RepID=UPI00319E288B
MTQYPTPFRRFLITVPSMVASTMVAVDITIANVALPHMQASLSASQEQVLWVLTSYLVAGAIATPLSGWLAGRLGRKLVMVVSVAGFTLASAMCGLATDLQTIVIARFLQGACGAALIPLSQAILLDINPPEDHAKAMAIFALGSMAGPIIGPTLGGYLTDALSWRWVFFINVPFGVVSFLGMIAFLYETRNEARHKFDMFGFVALAVALAAFQLMLDRGEHLDWFDSPEIQVYAAIAFLGFYLSLVHMFTARGTFIPPELFADRNFAIGSIFSVLIGMVAFATIPMIVVMTQTLLGYSAFQTGMIGLPRAIGTLVAMLLVTRLVAYIDIRALLIVGLTITGFSMLMYSWMDLFVDGHALLVAGFVQGVGGGLMFVPLSVIVFSTLPQHMRNEGAAMYSLTRNVGNAIGISALQYQYVHYVAGSRAGLVEGVRPDNPVLQLRQPDFDFGSVEALARMNAQIIRQASMVGNIEIYHLVFLMALAMVPLVLFMRTGRKAADGAPLPMGE